MTFPSKELLSAVLGEPIKLIESNKETIEDNYDEYPKENEVIVEYPARGFRSYRLWNIYELMHLMKKWCLSLSYDIKVEQRADNNSTVIEVGDLSSVFNVKQFASNAEFEAITATCEWVLRQTKPK